MSVGAEVCKRMKEDAERRMAEARAERREANRIERGMTVEQYNAWEHICLLHNFVKQGRWELRSNPYAFGEDGALAKMACEDIARYYDITFFQAQQGCVTLLEIEQSNYEADFGKWEWR